MRITNGWTILLLQISPIFILVEENAPQGWFFEIDGEIPVELHGSIKDFVCLCINKPVSGSHRVPINHLLVEEGGMQWTLSKQNLTVDLHLK